MKPILQNLVEMTGHRDHLRLEVSVLSTLQKLSSIIEVRALELFTEGGAPHVRPRTWVDNGELVSTDSDAAADPRRERARLGDLQAGADLVVHPYRQPQHMAALAW